MIDKTQSSKGLWFMGIDKIKYVYQKNPAPSIAEVERSKLFKCWIDNIINREMGLVGKPKQLDIYEQYKRNRGK